MQIRSDAKSNDIHNDQFLLEDYIQKIKEKNDKLGQELAKDFKDHATITNPDNLRTWLQLQNIINFYRVCLAFHRGGLFYSSDSKHPISKDKHNPQILTTMSSLMPVIVAEKTSSNLINASQIISSYLIKDKTKMSPTQILSELLFHRTTYECTGSVNLAFLLTLWDVMKVVHGEIAGTKLMDDFLSTDKSNNNATRLLLGGLSVFNMHTVGSLYFFKAYKDLFKPIDSYISKEKKSEIRLSELKEFPEKYRGVQVYIEGHKQYPKKHPKGFSRGWNTIFVGLDAKGSPLFLVACEIGQKFLVNYEELKCILMKGYNEFPPSYTPDAASLSKQEEIVGIVDVGTFFFNIDNVISLLSDPITAKKWVHNKINTNYNHQVVMGKERWILTDSQYDAEKDQKLFITRNIIKEAKDDCDPLILKFFKPSFRPDITKSHSKDDSGLFDPVPVRHRVKSLG